MADTIPSSYLIGISGGSGSGKTTFIRKLRNKFDDTQLCIISQDNYYRSREDQIFDRKGVRNFDLPTSLDLARFLTDVKQLQANHQVIRPEYNFNNPKVTPKTIIFRPAPIIIAEGLFVFCEENLKSLFDLKIMIDATDDKKIIRRIIRDRVERNYPLEDVLYRYEHHVVPAYFKYIAPHKKDADLIINNNENFDNALEVITSFIQCKLNNLKLSE